MEDNRPALAELASQIEATERTLAELITARDDAIRRELDAGAGPTALGRIFGLGRQRIYQIRDHRR